MFNDLILTLTGFFAGVVDSIAGGGGLITLPVLSEFLAPGPDAIGSNKIVGALGALVALLVYVRREPVSFKKGLLFVLGIGVGSMFGSIASPFLPKIYFRVLLILVCPVVLAMVWNKKYFLHEAQNHGSRPLSVVLFVGMLAGFYDGFFGPGGGTFMLLGLLWAAKLPLFEALVLSKLANTVSASVSLISYGIQGYVHFRFGMVTAVGMMIGSFVGAKFASQKAEKIVRPVLIFVVTLLMAVQLRELL